MRQRLRSLLVMIALTLAGLYLGRATPTVALTVVLLVLIGFWLFWFGWQEYHRTRS